MDAVYTIQNEWLTVQISARGAELRSIRDKAGTEYLWQGDPRYWDARAPHLFPFVARLWQGVYRLDGEQYAMDIHGFAQYCLFSVREQAPDRLVLEITDDERTQRAYPRAFAFRVCYTLTGQTLSVGYEVENRDSRTLPFGLGGHPGFRVPLAPGERFSDYRLHFEAPQSPQRVGFTPDCFPDGTEAPYPLENGTDLPLRHTLFDDDAIVLAGSGHAVQLQNAAGKARLRVCYPDMDWLGLWHAPQTEAPYLCIEPWCSLPSRYGEITDLMQKPDLIRIPPHQTELRSWSVTVQSE